MTDFGSMQLLAPARLRRPFPVTGDGVLDRLRLTLVASGYAAAFLPGLLLGILAILCVVLVPAAGIGVLLSVLVVPAVARLTAAHRRFSGQLLGEPIVSGYASASDAPTVVRPIRWLWDPARWRDIGFLWFSATGGFVMSLLPLALLTQPLTGSVLVFTEPGWLGWLMLALGGPALVGWWCVTPALVRGRALAERGILGHSRIARLEERVERAEESHAETLDHSAAEVRRIERDLHDGAQARIASVGMSVGLAKKLMHTDPTAAAELLREARETTVDALEDLRSVIRGIRPPVLADRGLSGAIQALTVAIPVPTTVSVDVPRLPPPVESAAYFAVAECLANTVKHARADRAWVTGQYAAERLQLSVGDNGRGGADARGSGLSGVARRLHVFAGQLRVHSPAGGPTLIELEVPCPLT